MSSIVVSSNPRLANSRKAASVSSARVRSFFRSRSPTFMSVGVSIGHRIAPGSPCDMAGVVKCQRDPYRRRIRERPKDPSGSRDGKETQPMQAYVLVQTDSERRHVAELLRTLPGVGYADDVSGPYDALALASDADGTGFDGVLDRIRMLPGVLHALAAPLARAVELTEPAAPPALATSDAA